MQLLKWLLVLSFFQILDEIEEHSIKIYQLPDAESDEDEDFKEQTRLLKVRALRPVHSVSSDSCFLWSTHLKWEELAGPEPWTA